MLPQAQFAIEFTPIPPGESGQERLTFIFSANPGEPMKPLSQVASGGELARLMLAIKIHTAYGDGVPVLVLDEIDSAISGITVRAVADKLMTLSQQCQIIAVTHQPILAAKAPWHLHVQKRVSTHSVHVSVVPLTDPRVRQGVLSRLASGLPEETQATSLFVQQLSA
jgi:DNA repair protein RecN (Recombination protein N)